ncbi:MAG: DUF951 domain-containing protein [Oscillospiraceae bacterium]|nr:DUF951 domain-containing protein [Oscillospiraceae bacterium]
MTTQFDVGDVVQMRKPHPCGADTWEVTRTGADVKIKCTGCGRIVMLDRMTFERRMKKVVSHKEGSTEHG